MFVEEVFIAMDGYKKPTWKYLRRLLEQILDYPHLILLKYLPMILSYFLGYLLGSFQGISRTIPVILDYIEPGHRHRHYPDL